MATTITAPVPVVHSGEYDPALTPQISAGSLFPDFVGACTTSAGNIRIRVTAPVDGIPDVAITFAATLLTYTSAGKLAYIPTVPGKYKVDVTDITAGETATVYIQVMESEGV